MTGADDVGETESPPLHKVGDEEEEETVGSNDGTGDWEGRGRIVGRVVGSGIGADDDVVGHSSGVGVKGEGLDAGDNDTGEDGSIVVEDGSGVARVGIVGYSGEVVETEGDGGVDEDRVDGIGVLLTFVGVVMGDGELSDPSLGPRVDGDGACVVETSCSFKATGLVVVGSLEGATGKLVKDGADGAIVALDPPLGPGVLVGEATGCGAVDGVHGGNVVGIVGVAPQGAMVGGLATGVNDPCGYKVGEIGVL